MLPTNRLESPDRPRAGEFKDPQGQRARPSPPRHSSGCAAAAQPWPAGVSPPSCSRTYTNTDTCNREPRKTGGEKGGGGSAGLPADWPSVRCQALPPWGGAPGRSPEPLCACAVRDGIPGFWVSAAAMRRAEFDTSHAVVLTSLGPLGKRKSRAEVLVFAGTHVTRKPGSYKELGCNMTFGSC